MILASHITQGNLCELMMLHKEKIRPQYCSCQSIKLCPGRLRPFVQKAVPVHTLTQTMLCDDPGGYHKGQNTKPGAVAVPARTVKQASPSPPTPFLWFSINTTKESWEAHRRGYASIRKDM